MLLHLENVVHDLCTSVSFHIFLEWGVNVQSSMLGSPSPVITPQKGLCTYQLVSLKGFMTRMCLEGLGCIPTILV